MSAVIENKDQSTGSNASAGSSASAEHAARGGFFTVYKRGQGYWTRLGTAAGAGLVGLFCLLFLYQQLPAWSKTLNDNKGVLLGILGGLLALYSLLVWWLINRPNNADFLIATDSEMKKVNWTSRKELLGSTRVVIFFMFMIAALLFFLDVVFGIVFWAIGVLRDPPINPRDWF